MNNIQTSYGRLDKSEGSYYTPRNIAEVLLDIAGYVGDVITDVRIIDPSCGDGALLEPACRRLISSLIDSGCEEADVARKIIEQMYAYELDAEELQRARQRVAEAANSMGISLEASQLVNFRIGDALELYRDDASSFDYVIGNPPYVRIHNLDEKPDSSYVEGMCDLYYAFFDIGQQLLHERGTMCYIAPSSWFTSRAGKAMRADLCRRGVVSGICDFGHYQVFAPYATAYTAIVRIETSRSETVQLYPVGEEGSVDIAGAVSVTQESIWCNGLCLPGAFDDIKDILLASGNICVRNGYATNLDRVFMSTKPRFEGSAIERGCVKASQCKLHYMLYPYDENGRLLSLDEIRTMSSDAAVLLESNQDALQARTQVDDNTWWQFGRSQGVSDTFTDKVAMQSLVKPGSEVRVACAPAGCGVYGGVYVIGMTQDELHRAVNDVVFSRYAASLRKYKSGGYYALGGKDIEHFLNWWAARNNH